MKEIAVVAITLLLLLILPVSAFADRIVTDQLGRPVTIPDTVNRVVVLQHQTINSLIQLNATETIAGILQSWKMRLGPGISRLAPQLASLPMPGDLTQVNMESLLQIKPQVVFVTNYAPTEMIEQIEKAGIPVVVISFLDDPDGGAGKLNASIKDEETSYNNGLQTAIRLIGTVVHRQKEAEELIEYTMAQRKITDNRIAQVPQENRLRIYMANPKLTTYGAGKYTGLMMNHAGGINVATKDILGTKQVSIEQVIAWNPEVIFVQDRYPEVIQEIMSDPSWAKIDALKNNRVYLMPEYAKAWGHPMPEAMAIGELWMAKKLYPDLFIDIDMQKQADEYYKRFYRTEYKETNAGNAQ